MHLTTMKMVFNAQTANAYTTYRDQHQEVGKWFTWDWFDIYWMFTSKVYHFDECTHLERSLQVRIIFNKLWQQWNIFRFDNNKHPEITDKCRLCGQVDSMLHLIIECKCGGMLDIWRDGRLALQTIMSEIGENKWKVELLEILVHLLKQEGAMHIWTATWQPHQIEYLRVKLEEKFQLSSCSEFEVIQIRSTLIRLNGILVAHMQETVADRIHRTKEMDREIINPLRKSRMRKDRGGPC